MHFGLDEDQQMIVDTVLRFAQAEVGPRAHDLDEAGAFAEEAVASLTELGLMGMFVDPERGGSGLNALSGALVIEELARHDASLAMTVLCHNAQACFHLDRYGDSAIRETWLPRLVSAEALGAWAADARGLEARAEGTDGGWRLFGAARFVPLAAQAAGMVVAANTSDGARSFWVERSSMTVTPVDGALGLRAAGLGHVTLDGASARMLEGAAVPGDVAQLGRIMLGAVSVGIGRGALEEGCGYALERKQFKKPIAQFQAIQWKIADVATEVDAARLLVHRAATLFDTEAGEADVAATQGRVLAADAAVKAAHEAIQIYGGNGFVREFPVERFLRDAKVLQSGFGAADELRQEISERQLGR